MEYYTPRARENPLAKAAQMMQIQQIVQQQQQKNALSKYLQSGADLGTPEGLKGLMQISPELGMQVRQQQSVIGANEALSQQRQAATGKIGAQQLAGIARHLATQHKALPPDQQTPNTWRSTWLPARQFAIDRGLATPEMLPEDATPDQVLAYVGPGFTPAEQGVERLGQDKLAEETQYDAARLGQFQQGIENLQSHRGALLAQDESQYGRTLAQDESQYGRTQTRLGSEFRVREGNIDARAGGGGTKPSEFDRTMIAAEIEPGSPEYIRAARIKAQLESAGGKPGSKEKPMTPTNAGKVAMLQQGEKDIEDARSLVFDKAGELNRGTLGLARFPGTSGLGEDARLLTSKIQNAVAAKLRIETGAAAPPADIESVAQRFLPTPLDTKVSALDKMNRLQEYMRSSLDLAGAPSKLRGGPTKMTGELRMPKTKTPGAESAEDAIKRLTGM